MAKKIKIKTHSGAKKRFNISKNGKVKYQKTKPSSQTDTEGYKEKAYQPCCRILRQDERCRS